MQTFYTAPENIADTVVTIGGVEYHHAVRVCRVRVGEHIGVLDGSGRRLIARIEHIGDTRLTAAVEKDVSGEGEPSLEIVIALAAIKPARFETAVEKCTELGVAGLVPVTAERCEPNIAHRLKPDRLRKIVLEAAKQSGRSRIPDISEPIGLDDLLGQSEGMLLGGSQHAETDLEQACGEAGDISRITVLIGPEGDFTESEYDKMKEVGVAMVSMGGLTLRAETAAIVAAARIVRAVGYRK